LDAARVDGASELRIWARIVLPLSRPALAALGTFSFVAYWNSFIWPLVVLRDPDRYPLAVGLLYLQGLFAHNTRLIAAGTVLAMLPILAVFLFAQRSFVQGLEGAVR
jgi:putative chitobiose transport system permease protein